MMTNVNISFHDTISTTLSVKVSDWVRARPPAPRLSILYCHGAVVHWFKIRAKWELIRPHPVIMGAVSRNFQYAIVTYSAAHIQG